MKETVWCGGLYWSYEHPAWLGLFATLTDGRVLLRHELAWQYTTPEVAAPEYLAFVGEKKIKPLYVASDPKLFRKSGGIGETVAETFLRAGVPLVRADDDRVNGWSRLRSWLQPATQRDGSLSPNLLVHSDCAVFKRAIPTLIADAKSMDDEIEPTPEMFPANATRYFVMSRPMPSKDLPVELPEGAIGHSLRALRAELAEGV